MVIPKLKLSEKGYLVLMGLFIDNTEICHSVKAVFIFKYKEWQPLKDPKS